MDGTFDHEDPNNRLEEIPLDDLNNYQDDEDQYFDTPSPSQIYETNLDDNDQNILADDIDINYNDQELRREWVWQRKVETIKSAITLLESSGMQGWIVEIPEIF